MLLSPQLIAAYEAAEYVVHERLAFRIGRRSAALDALLDEHAAGTAAFVTAANPRGERRDEAHNLAAAAALEAALEQPFLRGEGRDPQGQWPAEPSVLIFGIERGAAEALGRRLHQNALVFIERGKAPALVLLAKLRLVLDTQVWLDWLVFDDASSAPIRALLAADRAEIFIDEACEAELERVLGYRLGRLTLDPAARAACLARVRALAKRVATDLSSEERAALPRCSDPDDQKLLELSYAARADCLVTRDRALLALRTPLFQILSADALSGSARSPRRS